MQHFPVAVVTLRQCWAFKIIIKGKIEKGAALAHLHGRGDGDGITVSAIRTNGGLVHSVPNVLNLRGT